jgi:hypothetical protein
MFCANLLYKVFELRLIYDNRLKTYLKVGIQFILTFTFQSDCRLKIVLRLWIVAFQFQAQIAGTHQPFQGNLF